MNEVQLGSTIEFAIPLVLNLRAIQEKAQRVFHALIDSLILIFYLIQHVIHRLAHSRSDEEAVFKGQVLYHTHNFSKFSDLWSYVKLRRHPLGIPEREMEEFASDYGFSIKGQTGIWTKPHTKGMCMGGVTLFCKKWLETGNILQTAEAFRGGVPLEGALYQEAYDSLFQDVYYQTLEDKIKEIINTYPQPVLLDHSLEVVAYLFDGINAYLNQGLLPQEGGMTEWVREWVAENRDCTIPGKVYASLRKAVSEYDDVNTAEKDRTVAILNFAQLHSEILHFDASPGDLLSTIGSLQPGTYKLSLPCYNPFGKKIGHHAVAFVVQESGFSYFYDPNSCVACSSREEVQATIGRLCTTYTGFDYSRNLAGESPSFFKKAKNLFQERANPSSIPLIRGFDLFKLTAQTL